LPNPPKNGGERTARPRRNRPSMSRGPTTFRKRDVTAAVEAVTTAGYEVLRVEVGKDGRIIVVTSKGTVEAPEAADKNEWDDAV
jgi:hypothetical protein